jgi:hypothetical protein
MRVAINYDVVENMIDIKGASKQVKLWLNTTFKRWMINEYPDVVEINKANYKLTEKQLRKLSHGAKLIEFRIDANFIDKFNHMVDFMRTDQRMLPRQISINYEGIRGITVDSMLERTEAWTRWMARNAKKRIKDVKPDKEGTIKIIKEWDEYILVKLLEGGALKREGKLMGHCVGNISYVKALQRGDIEVYSIQTKDGIPHVTFNTRYNVIEQIQGYNDHAPAPRYIPYIVESINLIGFEDIAYNALDKIDRMIHMRKIYDRRLHNAAKRCDADTIDFLLNNGYKEIMNVPKRVYEMPPMAYTIGTPAMKIFMKHGAIMFHDTKWCHETLYKKY